MTLSGKEGGQEVSMRAVADVLENGGGGSLLSSNERWEDAGDSTEGSREASVDMVQ